jgi:hypothetical protein
LLCYRLTSLCVLYSFIFLSIPSEFIPFCALLKTYFTGSSPPTVTNITNTHCHSQLSPLLLFYQHPFSYIICSNSQHFHQFPNLHDRRQLTVIIFSDCDRKCTYTLMSQIITGLFQSTEGRTFLCVTLFVAQKFPHIYTRLHSSVSADVVTEFHIGYAELGSWPVIQIWGWNSLSLVFLCVYSGLLDRLVTRSDESCRRVCECVSNCVCSMNLNKQSL